MSVHYTEPYLLNPTHKVTINLVGCGGTGTQVLSGLARMNEALIALGHPGLHVRVFDADLVSPANVGRQLFSRADIGQSKAAISVTRVNRFFSYDWEAYPTMYECETHHSANITISCVDTIKVRTKMAKLLLRYPSKQPYQRQFYWLDFGNSQKTGQVVLGGIGANAVDLPNVVQLLPQIKKQKDKDTGPSCSLAEAIGKQDLYINSTLANLGLNILWKLFREGKIVNHGCFLNLDTLSVNPIKIKTHEAKRIPRATKKAR